VLCERPLALNLAGVERVLAASEKYGKRVMVGMNHRFRSDVQAVRGFLAGGDLGGLQAVRSGWYTFQPSRRCWAGGCGANRRAAARCSISGCRWSTWGCGWPAGPRPSGSPPI